jgi:arsenate reductase
VFPGGPTRIHWSFDDPSQAIGTDKGKLKKFRRIRDEILTRLRQWLADHGNPATE